MRCTLGQAPAVRLRGEVHLIEGPAVSPEHTETLLRSLADTRQMRQLHEHGKAEFLFTFRESVRFRVTARTEHDEVSKPGVHFEVAQIQSQWDERK